MHRNAGFSMVEVLVSIVILSIALLGTAGLMSSGLRGTNTAYFRSQATVLADDILDRMRANRSAAKLGQYDIDLGPAFSAASGTMAEYDVQEWTDTLADVLPGGEATVSVSAEGRAEITIQWAGDDNNSFVTRSSL